MTLDDAIARALAGDAGDLYALLSRGSGLPGERANIPLAKAFAQACATDQRGAKLATQMASLTADEAPGGSSLEFIPVCGVLAAGACAVRHPKVRGAMLAVLHDACDDLRFRVRDVAPPAIAALGAREGGALFDDLQPFLEGYFHAAAVLRALVLPDWLPTIDDAEKVASFLRGSLDLAEAAPRAAARWPGYKSLLEAIEASIAPLALRFGEPILATAASLARSRDPHLREVVTRALANKKLRARLPQELATAKEAFTATEKPIRDPRSLPGPTRRRGGGHRR